jgi:DnaK suppressor protein
VRTPAPRPIDDARARELVGAERSRIEVALGDLDGQVRGEGELQDQQAGDTRELGTDVAAEGVAMTLADGLRTRLLATDRAIARIDAGTYGRSIESGLPIPVERLEAEPLAERTVAEQAALEGGTR